jgi:hypothetical protein
MLFSGSSSHYETDIVICSAFSIVICSAFSTDKKQYQFFEGSPTVIFQKIGFYSENC